MSQFNPLLIKGLTNSEDLSNKKWFFAQMSNDNEVKLADGSVKPIGVIYDVNSADATSGGAVGIITHGTAKLVVKKNADNAYPSAGDYIVASSVGYGIKRKDEDYILVRAMALESASADGDIIEVILI
ncbi:MAG TPA: hypothetical protein PLN68_09960 [Elusimicrobiales bacterium]|nr:hypothetical protein [Elusimicrobiales bacterium]